MTWEKPEWSESSVLGEGVAELQPEQYTQAMSVLHEGPYKHSRPQARPTPQQESTKKVGFWTGGVCLSACSHSPVNAVAFKLGMCGE